ncbi:MAG: DUF559 domain-containing protein [Proteobacteria bacterium]|nr:DUF559 domain-containing protein [Pseudomonadota bacterium]
MNERQTTRLREFLSDKLVELCEPDQDETWVQERRRYLEEHWYDDFCLLSELVESPIEQQLGGYLLCVSDGYTEVTADFLPGAFPDPDFGTYFRCQQELYGYRSDFVFKLNFFGDWKLLNVECDGHPFHERSKEQAANDRRRDRLLEFKGIRVIRFAGTEIYNSPRKCAAEVEAILSVTMRDLLAEHGKEIRRRPPAIPD